MSADSAERKPSATSTTVATTELVPLAPARSRRLLGNRIPVLGYLQRKLTKRLDKARDRWRTARQPARIRLRGVRVAIDRARFSEKIIRRLYDGGYEREECIALQRTLEPNDRVLELGAGIGYLSTVAARRVGSQNVTAVEANDALAPVIEATHRANGVAPEMHYGVMSPGRDTTPQPFYRHVRNLWSSSLTDPGGDVVRVEVPTFSWQDTLERLQPTYIVMDIEGGEIALLEGLVADSVQRMLIEFHPRKTGQAAIDRVFVHLRTQRFTGERVAAGTNVFFFQRAG